MSCVATAATILLPLQPAAADDAYRVETHGPRIGSRIVLFFKDLAYGQNPNDRYRSTPSSSSRGPSQHREYGGPGYNLDEPAPVNSMPPQRMAYAPPPTSPSDDLPYTTDAPRPKEQAAPRKTAENPVPPPVKPKAKAPTPQKPPLFTSKTPVEQKPAKQQPAPPKESPPAEKPAKETEPQSASNTPSTRKSWQMFNSDSPKENKVASHPHEEPKTSPPAPVSTPSVTLTGSKTTKEGRVKSPYAPFNELDVTGLPGGSLAMDPTTGKVFRVP
jgi:hypothetical protein